MQPRYWVRAFVNIINCSTLLGLIAAAVGRARLTRGHHGLIIGWGYRFRIPPRRTPAFTLGNIILVRHEGPEILQRRPRLLVHEERHATQYAYCLGVAMVLLYVLASAWSLPAALSHRRWAVAAERDSAQESRLFWNKLNRRVAHDRR